MKKVLQVIRKMDYGGAETLIMNIYRTIDKEKIQFDFLICEDGIYNKEIKENGGRIFKTCKRRDGIIEYKKEMKNFFKENAKNYNTIHYHCSSLSNIYPVILAKKYGIKNIFIHAHNTHQPGIIHNVLNKINQCRIKKYVTKEFACSTEAGKYVFNNDKFEVIKNGIIAEKFKYNEDIANKKKKELDISVHSKVVINIGRLSPQKNQIFLIDIFNSLLKYDKNLILIIVGEGENREKIIERARKYNILNKVKIMSKRNDVNEILQVSDIFLLPSLYEGLPLVGIEAQATGMQIFMSDTISKEVDVTGNVCFYSLEKDSEKWAEEIMKKNKGYKRDNNAIKKIKISGYDVEETTKKLEKYYLE